MAGALTISTLNNDTGVLATQNGMTGIAKAWVNFDGTGTVSIRNSFNVSSITDRGTGQYTINFTTAMPNANYSLQGMGDFTSGVRTNTVTFDNPATNVPTTTACAIATLDVTTLRDGLYVCVAVFSS
jgi:hypothetical protein